MKTFITFLLLATALFTKAQIVNIPDANFKVALINLGIDTNNDGEIQQTEADVVTTLDIDSLDLRDLTGIRSFTNLKTLYCSANKLRIFDISGHTNIESINIRRYFSFDNDTGMAVFNAENCIRLKTVDLSTPNWPTLYTALMANLVNCDSLTSINLSLCPVAILDVSGSGIKHLGVWQVGTLIAKNCTSLISIVPDQSLTGGIGTVDVTGCTNLESLSYGEAGSVQTIDLSTCPNIKTVFVPYTSVSPLYVNLKNGTRMDNFSVGIIPWNGSIPVLNICADDFETDSASNWLQFVNMHNNPLTNINSYCSFFPGGSFNSISGNIRVDIDNNGCDSTDNVADNCLIRFSSTSEQTYITSANYQGKFKAYTYKGDFTLTPYFPYPYFTINPSSESVIFDTANSLTATRNFCITPNGIHNDVEIIFLPTFPPARPGFDAAYTLVYKNRGTTTLSGNVAVNFDNSKMNFVSASENVTPQSSGQLLWNYNNLQPFESKTINVTFNLLPPPVNNIGDTIIFLSAITPSTNDETAFDNSFILPQTVIGSFDPNDKQCLEGSKIDISKIGEYLHYQIRFQNEGTDTAFNIVVADILSDKLDWNSFEFIGSSHTADVKLTNNKLEFIFQNINLPYKAIDEPGSNGWIAFKIKPKPSVVIGDSLNNSAAIYFDFNLPVITNTATTIVTSSSTPVPVKLEYFSANKKENTNQLNWKASCTYGNAAFVIERSDDGINFKAIGNINATAVRCQLPFNFSDNDPAAGKNYYRLKITDADGKSFYSKVLVVGNNKAGIEITAVANNTVYLSSNKQQTVIMKVITADGREVLNQKQTIGTGNNNINLLMKNAAKGIYSLIICTEQGEPITKRFIK
ncbi:MAG: hypothetical protein V4685_11770 [Bacteroidota bacterium]